MITETRNKGDTLTKNEDTLSKMGNDMKMAGLEHVHFLGFSIPVYRKLFFRGIAIRFSTEAGFEIKVSQSTSQGEIEHFLATKQKWVEKHLLYTQKMALEKSKQTFVPGGKFSFIGRELELSVVPTPLSRAFVSIQGGRLLYHKPLATKGGSTLPFDNHVSGHIKKFFFSRSQQFLIERLQLWSKEMQLAPSKCQFRTQKSRWGSCTSVGGIQLNLKLIVFAEEVVDYVVIHELAHLKHLNHSKSFWGLVSQFCPDYRAIRKELREKHHLAAFLE